MTEKIAFSATAIFLLAWAAWTQSRPAAPVTLSVDTTSRLYAIPNDFVGLGFETASVLPDHYGVSGYFFAPQNTQLVTLFRNIGVKLIRIGGATVDGHHRANCDTPIPTKSDIDNLFEFARAAGVKVIYSLRLLNPSACADPSLASDDARLARYIWDRYRGNLHSFAIGNEPDLHGYHTYPDHPDDPLVVETTTGVPGSAYPSYLADWRHFANTILKAVPKAKFSGPDATDSPSGTYTPNPSAGVSWTQKFVEDEKGSGILVDATQHHYVWGRPGSTTVQQAIDNMLSGRWDGDTSLGTQPSGMSTTTFRPYPYLYDHNLAPIVSYGVPYRMTEANDCLHGVPGASNGFAAALWALDYMHWWAAHHMASVHFHNNPWLPTDTVVPDPNPCPASGCRNYYVTPKGCGMKAFDLGSHGYVEPVTIDNPQGINLTAYAVGDARNLYVTIINKTHSSTNNVADAVVTIRPKEFRAASAVWMSLTDGEPGNAALMTAMLGGAAITNHSRWLGKWLPLSPAANGDVTLTVQATTAAIVRMSGK